ncbi:hypothetical protein ACOMHN_028736 [Nucella lapillus]
MLKKYFDCFSLRFSSKEQQATVRPPPDQRPDMKGADNPSIQHCLPLSRPSAHGEKPHPLPGGTRNWATCAPRLNMADTEEKTSGAKSGRNMHSQIWLALTLAKPCPS